MITLLENTVSACIINTCMQGFGLDMAALTGTTLYDCMNPQNNPPEQQGNPFSTLCKSSEREFVSSYIRIRCLAETGTMRVQLFVHLFHCNFLCLRTVAKAAACMQVSSVASLAERADM